MARDAFANMLSSKRRCHETYSPSHVRLVDGAGDQSLPCPGFAGCGSAPDVGLATTLDVLEQGMHGTCCG